MNRKILLYPILGAAMLAAVVACQRYRMSDDQAPSDGGTSLTLADARDVFESHMTATRVTIPTYPDRIHPGDFVPHWDQAAINGNEYMDGADVPITPDFTFRAWYRYYNDQGQPAPRTVSVTQKLVVKKWLHPEADEPDMYPYIMTLIPRLDYYNDHKNYGKRFRYGRDQSDFSGLVMYHSLEGVLVALDVVVEGEISSHNYFPFVTLENGDSIDQIVTYELDRANIDRITGVRAYMPGTDEDDPINAGPVDVTGPGRRCNKCHALIIAGKCECLPPDIPKFPTPKPKPRIPNAGDPNLPTNTRNMNQTELNKINSLRERLKNDCLNRALMNAIADMDINIMVSPENLAMGSYIPQLNTLLVNPEYFEPGKEVELRQIIVHEFYHAYETLTMEWNDPTSIVGTPTVEFTAHTYMTIDTYREAVAHGTESSIKGSRLDTPETSYDYANDIAKMVHEDNINQNSLEILLAKYISSFETLYKHKDAGRNIPAANKNNIGMLVRLLNKVKANPC